MPTAQERYAAATAYVRRAITTVEDRGIAYAVDPITGIVEWYAGKVKTFAPRNELARIEAKWLRATTDPSRTSIAREAELLADRVEENLPGAPQDRPRTNLSQNEVPKGTPGTSYYGEVGGQAGHMWGFVQDEASAAGKHALSLGKWLLLGGGVVLGWKTVNYLRKRNRDRIRGDELEDVLDANVEQLANARNAGAAIERQYSLELSADEIEALYWLRGRYESARAFFDALEPLDEAADHALGREFEFGEGPYRFQICASDVRDALAATSEDGGDYGSIPNLRSPSVESVLSDEASYET